MEFMNLSIINIDFQENTKDVDTILGVLYFSKLIFAYVL